jgi:hypothetical protein
MERFNIRVGKRSEELVKGTSHMDDERDNEDQNIHFEILTLPKVHICHYPCGTLKTSYQHFRTIWSISHHYGDESI